MYSSFASDSIDSVYNALHRTVVHDTATMENFDPSDQAAVMGAGPRSKGVKKPTAVPKTPAKKPRTKFPTRPSDSGDDMESAYQLMRDAIKQHSDMPITLDTRVMGHVVLPAGYDWDIPHHTAPHVPGPVELDKTEYFRYDSKGNAEKLHGAGAHSVVIFGKKHGSGERVIARLQSAKRRPPFIPVRGSPDRPIDRNEGMRPTIAQINAQIDVYVKSNNWHLRCARGGFASKIYEATIYTWLSIPEGTVNGNPTFLQITQAQDMDLNAYLSDFKNSRIQKADALFQFVKRYWHMLVETNIVTIDMKPRNITVNVSEGRVTELMFIDIDDEHTFEISADDDERRTIFWIAGVIQTLAIAERTIPKNQMPLWQWPDPINKPLRVMISNWVREPEQQSRLKVDSWDAVRSFDKRTVDTDPIFKQLLDLLGKRQTNIDPAEQKLSEVFYWYHIRAGRSLDMVMDNFRKMAANHAMLPTGEFVRRSIHTLMGGSPGEYHLATAEWRKDTILKDLLRRLGRLSLR